MQRYSDTRRGQPSRSATLGEFAGTLAPGLLCAVSIDCAEIGIEVGFGCARYKAQVANERQAHATEIFFKRVGGLLKLCSSNVSHNPLANTS